MSTFSHYQAPSSLPADYAILSRYAGHHPDEHEAPQSDSEDQDPSTSSRPSSAGRRQSFPESYIRPRNPTMGFAEGTKPPTEISPLLNPPIPRIDEEMNRNDVDDDGTRLSMYWEELRILTRYSLPVFG